MTLVLGIAIAGLASLLADGVEHYLLFARNGNRWPRNLPIAGVIIAALARSALSMVAMLLLNVTETITTLSGAAVVGFSLPQVLTIFLGRSSTPVQPRSTMEMTKGEVALQTTQPADIELQSLDNPSGAVQQPTNDSIHELDRPGRPAADLDMRDAQ